MSEAGAPRPLAAELSNQRTHGGVSVPLMTPDPPTPRPHPRHQQARGGAAGHRPPGLDAQPEALSPERPDRTRTDQTGPDRTRTEQTSGRGTGAGPAPGGVCRTNERAALCVHDDVSTICSQPKRREVPPECRSHDVSPREDEQVTAVSCFQPAHMTIYGALRRYERHGEDVRQ